VSYVTSLLPSRSLTDTDGHIRTAADTAAPAPAPGMRAVFACRWEWLHSGRRSRHNVAEGAGLNAQGTGKIKNALPAWLRNRRITCGVCSPPFRANRMGIRPTTCFRLTAASRGRLLCARHCG